MDLAEKAAVAPSRRSGPWDATVYRSGRMESRPPEPWPADRQISAWPWRDFPSSLVMKRNRPTPPRQDARFLEAPKSKKAGPRVRLLDVDLRHARKPAGRHRKPGLALCRIRHILERKVTADKPLVWLREEDRAEIRTPPLSARARLEAGYLLRRLQRGEVLSMPESRPMPSIGARCHELRINDEEGAWRIFYRTDPDAIVLLDVLQKKTRETPGHVIETCRRRLAEYDRLR